MPLEFKTHHEGGFHIIKMPATLEQQNASQIEAAVKSWLLSQDEVHVLDFSETKTISSFVYRPFILFGQQLRLNHKALFSIGVSQKILNQFKTDGVSQVFSSVADLGDVKKRTAVTTTEKASLNVEIVNPFIQATQIVLGTQASTPLTAGKPSLKSPTVQPPVDIAGHIALNSKEFTGSVTLCFPSQVFLNVYENMVGEKRSEIDAEIQDAAGELLNIIFGQAKTILNDTMGYTLDKALPTILVGDRLRIHHQVASTIILLPFMSQAGDFHLEIAIHKG